MLLDTETLEGDEWDKRASIEAYLEDFFEKNESIYLEDKGVTFTYHPSPLINAMIILDRFKESPNGDVISASEHDQIYFDVDQEKFVTEVTLAEAFELIRAGIRFDSDGFTMFT